jgi:hypothetical protein
MPATDLILDGEVSVQDRSRRADFVALDTDLTVRTRILGQVRAEGGHREGVPSARRWKAREGVGGFRDLDLSGDPVLLRLFLGSRPRIVRLAGIEGAHGADSA